MCSGDKERKGMEDCPKDQKRWYWGFGMLRDGLVVWGG